MRKKTWSSNEVKVVKLLFPYYRTKELANILGVTVSQIRKVCYENGMKGARGQRALSTLPYKGYLRDILNLLESDMEEEQYEVEFRGFEQPGPSSLRYGDQICWTCQNACDMTRCSWVPPICRPVEGWDADRIQIRQSDKGQVKVIDTYYIRSCPNYIPDPPRPIYRRKRVRRSAD